METRSNAPSSSMSEGRLAKTAGYYLAFIAVGMVSAVFGPTLLGLAKQTGAGLGDMSFLFAARAVGYLCGALVGGRLYDRYPGHPIFVLFLGLLAVFMVGIPLIPMFWGLMSVLMLGGLSENLLIVGGNTLLIWVHRRQVGPFMNGLHFCFGFGCFLAPLIIAQVLAATDTITWAYWILAFLLVPVAVFFVVVPSPQSPAANGASRPGIANRLLVGVTALFFFLCTGTEVAFGGWIYTYIVTLNLADKAGAAYVTSVFWGALTLGRLLTIPLAARIRPVTLLFSCLAGCVVSLGIMLFWQASLLLLTGGVLGLGGCMAAIVPTILSFSERRMVITGAVTGWFFVGSSLGIMTLPWLIGQCFEPYGPSVMLWILLAALLAAVAVLAGITLKNAPTQTPGK